jgi:hypothetical protein
MATDNRETTLVKFVGYPDGPKGFVPELDCETPTFNMEPPRWIETSIATTWLVAARPNTDITGYPGGRMGVSRGDIGLRMRDRHMP